MLTGILKGHYANIFPNECFTECFGREILSAFGQDYRYLKVNNGYITQRIYKAV